MARAVVPKRTGNLASTIEAEAEADGSARLTAGGPRAPYAPLVNNGHPSAGRGYTPGSHFFDEAIERAEGEARARAAKLKPYK